MNDLGSLNKVLNNLSRQDLLDFGDGRRIRKMRVGKWDVSRRAVDPLTFIPKLQITRNFHIPKSVGRDSKRVNKSHG